MFLSHMLRKSTPWTPWCWKIYQHLPHECPSFVGRYTSTMGCIWLFDLFGMLGRCTAFSGMIPNGGDQDWLRHLPVHAAESHFFCEFAMDTEWMVFGNPAPVDGLPSGELTVCNGKWPFIVDFPIKNGDFPLLR